MAGEVLLVALSVLWPIVATAYAYPPFVLLLGVCAHLACAATGTAVGLLCARPVIDRVGWSLLVAVAVVVVTGVQPWLPPVGTAVHTLIAGGPIAAAGFDALLALVLAGAAAVASAGVARRR